MVGLLPGQGGGVGMHAALNGLAAAFPDEYSTNAWPSFPPSRSKNSDRLGVCEPSGFCRKAHDVFSVHPFPADAEHKDCANTYDPIHPPPGALWLVPMTRRESGLISASRGPHEIYFFSIYLPASTIQWRIHQYQRPF